MKRNTVRGKTIDDATRCVHYHSPLDVIAIKFKCCGEYYPCFECHSETSGHTASRWARNEFSTRAVLCGICGEEMSIAEYLASGNQCPCCGASFNPGCSKHYHLYFDI